MMHELLFSHILYINLKHRLDRRLQFLKMAHANHLESLVGGARKIIRIPGVLIDADNVPEADIWFDFKNPSDYRNPLLGEIGCALGHIEAWKKVIELDEACLIFEDDAIPMPDVNVCHEIRYLSTDGNLSRHWDIFYLGRQRMWGDEEINEYIVKPGMTWLLHAYILRPSGAKKLLATHFEHNLFAVDNYVPAMFGQSFDSVTPQFAHYEQLEALATKNDIFKQRHDMRNDRELRLKNTDIDRSDEIFKLGQDPTKETYCHYTCASDIKQADMLNDSVIRHGWNYSYNTFGVNTSPWVGDMKGPGGATKLYKLHEAMKSITDPEAIVVFTDAYDVVLLAPPKSVIRDWLENFDHVDKVTFAAEYALWPPYDDITTNEQISGYEGLTYINRSSWLNSGCFIGRARNVRKVVERAMQFCTKNGDDQAAYQVVWLTSEMIELDETRVLFQCLNDCSSDQVTFDGTWCFNKTYNTHPLIIHGNGPTKEDIRKLSELAKFHNSTDWVGKKTIEFGPQH